MRTLLSLGVALLMFVGCSAPGVSHTADTKPVINTGTVAPAVDCAAASLLRLTATSNVPNPPIGNGCIASDPRTSSFYKQSLMPLALTIWAESRGEGERGMRLVGHVILNRRNKGSWGDTVNSVVMARAQFSPWAKGSATRRRLESMRAAVLAGSKVGVPQDFQTALGIADALLSAEVTKTRRDESLGSIYFHAKYIRPAWSKAERVTIRHGGHVFLR